MTGGFRARQNKTAAVSAFIFACPETSMRVQHWLDSDEDSDEAKYEAVTCAACTKVHFINRNTRKLFGEDED
jgi:hypothetical protein